MVIATGRRKFAKLIFFCIFFILFGTVIVLVFVNVSPASEIISEDDSFKETEIKNVQSSKIIAGEWISPDELSCKNNYIFEENVDQNDVCLVETIRSNYLISPSKKDYNFTEFPARSSEEPLIDLIQDLLPDRKGFFIECGANDGEFTSNTLILELDYQWTGLLIEAHTETFEKLKAKNRKAWLVNLCLSPHKYTEKLKFFVNPKAPNVNALWDRHDFGETVKTTVNCVPLFSILKAINISHVDYFSLDIEGAELDVLKTIPFHLISFHILSVEHWFVPGGLKAVSDFLATKGYTLVTVIENDYTRDGIYVNNSIIPKLKTTIKQ